MHVTTLGIDLAKQVFQLHGVDARGHAVLSRRVKRSQLVAAVASLPPCVIGMEACASAHHWGRAFEQLGHTVKLMSPQYVKPYVKTNKNDCRDAEAICEAVSRPTMRFVAIKTVDQADLQAVHRSRTLLIKTRTAFINQIRGLLAEYGLVIAQSPEKVRPALVRFLDDAESGLTAFARETFSELYEQLVELEQRITKVNQRLDRLFNTHPVCRKLAAVPGIGPLTATALLAAISRPHVFQNGRHLAAWLGLVPRQFSSGGHARLGGLSKRGNRYVRTLLIHGARAVVQRAAHKTDARARWMWALKCRKGTNVAAVALANKNARVIWALLAHDEVYRQSV
ncbi:MAG: IS110 family transposase [Nitrospirae bacterium]|nr:MAG: IS110 family transposase [Nitrospirota bacterium]